MIEAPFLLYLGHSSDPVGIKTSRGLAEFRRSLEGPDAPPLQPWDVAYYAEKQRQALYEVDDEALRPYFPAPAVLAGLFEVVQRLYGIRVTATDDFPTWHPDVRYFDVHDARTGKFLSGFYLDLFPDIVRGCMDHWSVVDDTLFGLADLGFGCPELGSFSLAEIERLRQSAPARAPSRWLRWLRRWGAREVLVNTQEDNLTALALYDACSAVSKASDAAGISPRSSRMSPCACRSTATAANTRRSVAGKSWPTTW